MPWAFYLWPGLPQLAGRGSWAALAVAIGAAALLCVALLGTFVWTELLTANLRILYWLLLLAVWSGSAGLLAWMDHRRAGGTEPEGSQDLFRQSLDHYLQGNWLEAQQTLGRLLRGNCRDVEARLLLATLLRHTGRPAEAARQLDVLVRLDEARKWDWEIRHEMDLLAAARDDGQASEVETADVRERQAEITN
jgi:hypothetical protein